MLLRGTRRFLGAFSSAHYHCLKGSFLEMESIVIIPTNPGGTKKKGKPGTGGGKENVPSFMGPTFSSFSRAQTAVRFSIIELCYLRSSPYLSMFQKV